MRSAEVIILLVFLLRWGTGAVPLKKQWPHFHCHISRDKEMPKCFIYEWNNPTHQEAVPPACEFPFPAAAPVTFQWTHWHFFLIPLQEPIISVSIISYRSLHRILRCACSMRSSLWCLNFQISWNEKTTASKFQFAVRQSLWTPHLSFYRWCTKG